MQHAPTVSAHRFLFGLTGFPCERTLLTKGDVEGLKFLLFLLLSHNSGTVILKRSEKSIPWASECGLFVLQLKEKDFETVGLSLTLQTCIFKMIIWLLNLQSLLHMIKDLVF